MNRPLIAIALLGLTTVAAAAERRHPYDYRAYEPVYADRHYDLRPVHRGWFGNPCAAKEHQLHRFQREAGRDGRYSKDEQRWISVMQSELSQCHASRPRSRWSRWF